MPTDRRSHKISRKAKITIFVMLGLLPVLYIGLGCIDAPAKEYPDMEIPVASVVPDEENVVVGIIKAYEELTEDQSWSQHLSAREYDSYNTPDPHNLLAPNHNYDTAYWEKVFKDNQVALELLEESLKRPHFSYPRRYAVDESCPYIGAITLHRLLFARSIYHWKKGQWDKCIEDIHLYTTFPQHLYNDPGNTLVDSLIAIAIDSNRHQNILYLLNHGNLTKKQLLQLKALIDQDTKNIHQSITRSFKSEFQMIKNSCLDPPTNSHIGIDGPITPYHLHPNRTTQFAYHSYKELIDISTQEPHQILIRSTALSRATSTTSSPKWKKVVKYYLLPNASGEQIILMFTTPIIIKQALRAYQIKIQRDLLLLKVAAQLYEREHNSLPDSIEDLYPYLTAPVYDPMTKSPKTPYRYSREKKRIWSLGENFIDDGCPDEYHLTSSDTSSLEFAIGL